MRAFVCTICGFLYDQGSAQKNANGKTIPFDKLACNWNCPECGAKGYFFQETNSEEILRSIFSPHI